MSLVLNLDLILVGIAGALILILGALIFLNNIRSRTNQAFLFLTITTFLWSFFNYLLYQIEFSSTSLTYLRIATYFAVWNAYSIFLFFTVFPDEDIKLKKFHTRFILPVVTITSFLTLTPLVFQKILSFDLDGKIDKVLNGPAIALFAIVVLSMIIGGFITLYRKMKHREEGQNFLFMFIGSLITFLFIVIFNFIFPAFLENPSLVKFGALFTFPFVMFTGYAVFKYHLFNIKVITTEILTFLLWIFMVIRILTAQNPGDRILDIGMLLVTIVVGTLLIRGVIREVKQRERLEVLTKELGEANEKLKSLDKLKTEFLSLASHQLRSPLTAIKGYTSMLLEGSFGEVNQNQKGAIDRVFQSVDHLTKVVEDLLNVTKIEQGGMQYSMAPFDLGKAVKDITTDLSITAKNKGLDMNFESDGKETYMVNGDMEKIRQVILNLVDNSIKYTKAGWIRIRVESLGQSTIRFSVSDSGMGMTPEVKASLFQKFSRGEGGRVNTGGSGLGLYLAKQIVEAHKGKIWIESEGLEKGSTFIVEFPASS